MNILHKLHTDWHSRPGYGSPGEGTHNRTALSNRRPINHRHTNRRKSPMPEYPMPEYPTPATPTSISLEVLSPAAHWASVTSPRTSLASGKLPTRLLSLSCAPAGFSFPLLCRMWVACADRPHDPLKQQITRLSFSGYAN